MKQDKSKFSIKPFFQKIEKPWGYELILTSESAPITGKILHLNKGARFSFQYHDKKEEALCLLNGQAKLIIEDKSGQIQEIEMEPRKGYFIHCFQKHRCQGITDCDILESSTREEGKTVRLEDDYDRGTETEKNRKQRGKNEIYTG